MNENIKINKRKKEPVSAHNIKYLAPVIKSKPKDNNKKSGDDNKKQEKKQWDIMKKPDAI